MVTKAIAAGFEQADIEKPLRMQLTGASWTAIGSLAAICLGFIGIVLWAVDTVRSKNQTWQPPSTRRSRIWQLAMRSLTAHCTGYLINSQRWFKTLQAERSTSLSTTSRQTPTVRSEKWPPTGPGCTHWLHVYTKRERILSASRGCPNWNAQNERLSL